MNFPSYPPQFFSPKMPPASQVTFGNYPQDHVRSQYQQPIFSMPVEQKSSDTLSDYEKYVMLSQYQASQHSGYSFGVGMGNNSLFSSASMYNSSMYSAGSYYPVNIKSVYNDDEVDYLVDSGFDSVSDLGDSIGQFGSTISKEAPKAFGAAGNILKSLVDVGVQAASTVIIAGVAVPLGLIGAILGGDNYEDYEDYEGKKHKKKGKCKKY